MLLRVMCLRARVLLRVTCLRAGVLLRLTCLHAGGLQLVGLPKVCPASEGEAHYYIIKPLVL